MCLLPGFDCAIEPPDHPADPVLQWRWRRKRMATTLNKEAFLFTPWSPVVMLLDALKWKWIDDQVHWRAFRICIFFCICIPLALVFTRTERRCIVMLIIELHRLFFLSCWKVNAERSVYSASCIIPERVSFSLACLHWRRAISRSSVSARRYGLIGGFVWTVFSFHSLNSHGHLLDGIASQHEKMRAWEPILLKGKRSKQRHAAPPKERWFGSVRNLYSQRPEWEGYLSSTKRLTTRHVTSKGDVKWVICSVWCCNRLGLRSVEPTVVMEWELHSQNNSFSKYIGLHASGY